jgi:hypothetical protein
MIQSDNNSGLSARLQSNLLSDLNSVGFAESAPHLVHYLKRLYVALKSVGTNLVP